MRRPAAFRFSAAQRFWWALCLAMLLPLAQAASSSHGISHLQTDPIDAGGKPALHLTHCDLCLAAAAVQSGALPSLPPTIAAPPAVHAAPLARVVASETLLGARAYDSRAPPQPLN